MNCRIQNHERAGIRLKCVKKKLQLLLLRAEVIQGSHPHHPFRDYIPGRFPGFLLRLPTSEFFQKRYYIGLVADHITGICLYHTHLNGPGMFRQGLEQ